MVTFLDTLVKSETTSKKLFSFYLQFKLEKIIIKSEMPILIKYHNYVFFKPVLCKLNAAKSVLKTQDLNASIIYCLPRIYKRNWLFDSTIPTDGQPT